MIIVIIVIDRSSGCAQTGAYLSRNNLGQLPFFSPNSRQVSFQQTNKLTSQLPASFPNGALEAELLAPKSSILSQDRRQRDWTWK